MVFTNTFTNFEVSETSLFLHHNFELPLDSFKIKLLLTINDSLVESVLIELPKENIDTKSLY